ncbi:MAG: hypothetical protein CMB16_02325 [Euryarchaeota archaeon]|nr:hypothetical protein [Euryarchaeota archaeon]|tara:strand:+ start:743 stop:1246 length:504 start_codon:yes stop_codon:yes gene_type:complete
MEDNLVDLGNDIIFLYQSGISPEKIAEIKQVDTELIRKILSSVATKTKAKKKRNIVQEVGNQNKWKNELPPDEILEIMAKSLNPEEHYDGQRTIPSRPIPAVDRSDRPGEDSQMSDRIEAERRAAEAPKPLRDIVESATLDEIKRKRSDWEKVSSEVSDLIDSDLDL